MGNVQDAQCGLDGGKDPPVKRRVLEAGASRNKSISSLFPIFIPWLCAVDFSFLFLTWQHSFLNNVKSYQLDCCSFTSLLDSKDLLKTNQMVCTVANMKDLDHVLLPSKSLYSRILWRDGKYPRAADLEHFMSCSHLFLHQTGLFCLLQNTKVYFE